MSRHAIVRLGIVMAIVMASVTVGAQSSGPQRANTAANDAVSIMPGQVQSFASVQNAGERRWFNFMAFPHRSYCAEVTQSNSTQHQDPIVEVYSDVGATLFGMNDQMTGEPKGHEQARLCWMTPATVPAAGALWHVAVKNSGNATNWAHSLRVVETTLWSSWFFQAGDYNSFLLMRNATTVPVTYRIRYYDAAGTVVGDSLDLTVGPQGGVGANSRAVVPLTTINGTVEIVHDGPPGALVGQMTSLSATTGLGFDAPLFIRESWYGR